MEKIALRSKLIGLSFTRSESFGSNVIFESYFEHWGTFVPSIARLLEGFFLYSGSIKFHPKVDKSFPGQRL